MNKFKYRYEPIKIPNSCDTCSNYFECEEPENLFQSRCDGILNESQIRSMKIERACSCCYYEREADDE